MRKKKKRNEKSVENGKNGRRDTHRAGRKESRNEQKQIKRKANGEKRDIDRYCEFIFMNTSIDIYRINTSLKDNKNYIDSSNKLYVMMTALM